MMRARAGTTMAASDGHAHVAAGVPPTVVMLFMRHKKPSLSLVTYNDPRMTDARKALGALPKLGQA